MREYSLGTLHGLSPVLPPEQIGRFQAVGRKVRVDKGSFFYFQGEAADRIFLLRSGRANSFLINSKEQESLLRIHLPGSLLGLTAFASRPVRDATAIAVKTCETIAITRADLTFLLRDDPQLSENLIRLLIDRMSDFHYRVGQLLWLSVEQRLAQALLSLSRSKLQFAHEGVNEAVSLTHEQLGNLLNTRRPTVSAILSKFTRAGLIARTDDGVLVINRNGLAGIALDPGPS